MSKTLQWWCSQWRSGVSTRNTYCRTMKGRQHCICIIYKHRCVRLKAWYQWSWHDIRIIHVCHCHCKWRLGMDRWSTWDRESLCKWRINQWTRLRCCCSCRNNHINSYSHISWRWYRGCHPHHICRICTTNKNFLWTLRIGCRSGTWIKKNYFRETFATSQSHMKINLQVLKNQKRKYLWEKISKIGNLAHKSPIGRANLFTVIFGKQPLV